MVVVAYRDRYSNWFARILSDQRKGWSASNAIYDGDAQVKSPQINLCGLFSSRSAIILMNPQF